MADYFEKWLCETLPDPREDALEGRIHLAVLRDRLRRTRRRRDAGRFLTVAVPVLVLVLFAGGVGDLGSDDFALRRLASDDGSTQVVVQGMRETGVQVLPGDDPADVREIVQQLAAGEKTIREVQGWELGGKTFWSLTVGFRIDGEEVVRQSELQHTPSELTEDISRFITSPEWERFDAKIREGAVEAQGTLDVVLDGVPCTVRTYVLHSVEFGSIVYFRGRPTP